MLPAALEESNPRWPRVPELTVTLAVTHLDPCLVPVLREADLDQRRLADRAGPPRVDDSVGWLADHYLPHLVLFTAVGAFEESTADFSLQLQLRTLEAAMATRPPQLHLLRKRSERVLDPAAHTYRAK